MDHPVEQLEKWLDNTAEKVQRNVQIVTPIDIEQDFLMHISTDTAIRNFVPMIGRRQAKVEDRTVPRICVCPTILGCFIGYGKAEDDFLSLLSDGSKENEKYKGGWKIYYFPFRAALRPNRNLVYDAKASDEIWLTAYSPESAEYTPSVAGKIFFRKIEYLGRAGFSVRGHAELYIEVTKEGGIPFSKNIWMDRGYWMIDGPLQSHVKDWSQDKEYTAKPISKEVYLSAKNAHADLLGLNEPVPAHQRW